MWTVKPGKRGRKQRVEVGEGMTLAQATLGYLLAADTGSD